jgi:D-beta-D-heptose 7-phosphate kinase/D-beta-D-heptose 1-phosphate adenosyltransferase
VHRERALGLLDRFHGAHVIVLGDVMLDRFVYGSVQRISPEAPVPVLSIERTLDMPGGAANVARNVVSLGARCTLLGVVGADEGAFELRSQLAKFPAIATRLIADSSRLTPLKIRYVADGQQVMRADRERRDALSTDSATKLLADLAAAIAQGDILVLSDYAKGVLTDLVVRESIAIAKRAGKPVIVDPKSTNLSRYRGATVLTPNRQELQNASGLECTTTDQVCHAAREILAAGVCEVLVVTRGKEGMSVIEAGGKFVHLPTEARQVFDVSGAGDTVIATLALSIASGGAIEDCASFANLAAGIVVGKRGTATVTPVEVLAAMPKLETGADPSKIYSTEHVLRLAREWRARGERIAFTNGCFDLLHPGHISLLEQARNSADRLIVGLNADDSVRRLKGAARPIQGEISRAVVLAAVKSVDAVVIFSSDTPLELIKDLQPDVLVKGSDYTLETTVGAAEVLSAGGQVLFAELVAGHSTSETVRRVADPSAS